MAADSMRAQVDEVRAFNRFYTPEVGALDRTLLHSPFSLTEVRVLYEIANGAGVTATGLAELLRIDAGYLSRIIRRFQERRLIRRERSPLDGRESRLSLTAAGRRAFAKLNRLAQTEVTRRLEPLSLHNRSRLVEAMRVIRDILEPAPDRTTGARPVELRAPRPGDLGWIVHRHGVLYAEEFGWDQRFEGLVAGIVAAFAAKNDAATERCWIADSQGEPVGSVFLVRRSPRVAQLRLLLVEPSARGLGVGARLVDECINFAREAGYRKLMLWTHSNLIAARQIYARRGFALATEERYEAFGQQLVNETWELRL